MFTEGESQGNQAELEKKDQLVNNVINEFKEKGYDMLAYSVKGGYVYGSNEKDIPKGAIDEYYPIDSDEARSAVERSIEEGHNYETSDNETEKIKE